MKSILSLFILASLCLTTGAQVKIKPIPSPGYEKRIADFIDKMTVIDTHEHLLDPQRMEEYTSLDFMLLLHQYSSWDIISAGMPPRTFKLLLKDSLTIKEKWQILQPFWDASKITAFNRVALLAADRLFGVNDINESTVEILSDKIKKAYKTDWFNRILIDSCKIDYFIQDDWDHNRFFSNPRYRLAPRFDDFIHINSKQNISSIGRQQNTKIETLDELVNTLYQAFNVAKKKGTVAIKTKGVPFDHILDFDNVSRERAEKVFNLIIDSSEGTIHPVAEVKDLQDYMMKCLLDLADKNKLPVVIHTGLIPVPPGNGDINKKGDPLYLINWFRKYPGVNFVLYHGSYPYGGELAALAKTYPNVYIDMCILLVVSPSYSERYLHEWLEMVPTSKIMAFGGDYNNIENVYGNLLFAKEIISRVLTEKVKNGYLTEEEAKNVARMILHDNAAKLYKLPDE